MPTPEILAMQEARDRRSREIAEAVLNDPKMMEQIRQSADDPNPRRSFRDVLRELEEQPR